MQPATVRTWSAVSDANHQFERPCLCIPNYHQTIMDVAWRVGLHITGTFNEFVHSSAMGRVWHSTCHMVHDRLQWLGEVPWHRYGSNVAHRHNKLMPYAAVRRGKSRRAKAG